MKRTNQKNLVIGPTLLNDDTLSLEDAIQYLSIVLHEFPFADWRVDNSRLRENRASRGC